MNTQINSEDDFEARIWEMVALNKKSYVLPTELREDLQPVYEQLALSQQTFYDFLSVEHSSEKDFENVSGLTVAEVNKSNEEKWVRFKRFTRTSVIFSEALILQVSNWLKKNSRYNTQLLAMSSQKDDFDLSFEKLMNLGSRVNGVHWACGVQTCANYIRHKDEWRYSYFKKHRAGKKFEKRKNVISTLKHSGSRKTARALITLGLTEEDIFSRKDSLSDNLLKILKMDDPNLLAKQGEAWLASMDKFVQAALEKEIGDRKRKIGFIKALEVKIEEGKI